MGQLILILFSLAVAGGFIAFWGDRLGTRVGKKRLSLFHLRPRDTATLLTIVSGALIAFFAVLALLAYDKDLRHAVIFGAQIRRQNTELLSGLGETERELTAAENSLDSAQAQEAEATKHELGAELLRVHADEALGRTRHVLGLAQVSLASNKKQLTLQRSQLLKANENLGAAQSNLRLTRESLLDETASLASATATVHTQEKRVADLVRQGAMLEDNIKSLTAQNTDLENQHSTLIKQPLIYNKGQEMGRTVISTNQTYSAIRNQVTGFLEQLSQNAIQLGGKGGANGRAVVLVPPNPVPGLNEEMDIDSVAHSIQDAEYRADSIVLVATATVNSFSGEQSLAQIKLYKNVLIFADGAIIASAPIDGSQTEDKVFSEIKQFLKSDVRPVAMRRGVIPTYDPLTGEYSVGQPTDSAQTLALVNQIESYGQSAVISAAASSDTYSNGPLRIKLTASSGLSVVSPAVNPISSQSTGVSVRSLSTPITVRRSPSH